MGASPEQAEINPFPASGKYCVVLSSIPPPLLHNFGKLFADIKSLRDGDVRLRPIRGPNVEDYLITSFDKRQALCATVMPSKLQPVGFSFVSIYLEGSRSTKFCILHLFVDAVAGQPSQGEMVAVGVFDAGAGRSARGQIS
jgi:hypothetical protein